MDKKLIAGGIALATCAVLASGCGQDQDNTALVKEVVLGNESKVKQLATGTKEEVSAVVDRYVNNGGINNKEFKLYVKSVSNPETLNTLIDNLTEIALNDPMFKSREDVIAARYAKEGIKIVKNEIKTRGITTAKGEITLMEAIVLGDKNAVKKLATGTKEEVSEVVDRYINNGGFNNQDLELYVKSIKKPQTLNNLIDSLTEIALNDPLIKTRNDLIAARKAKEGLQIVKKEMITNGMKISKTDIPMMYTKAVGAYKIEQALGNQRT